MSEHADLPQVRGSWVRHGTDALLRRRFFAVRSDLVTTPAGTEGRYDWVDAPDLVRVAAITAAGEIYLIRQHHYLPDRTFLQLPGGGVEPGETPLQAAARELAEEVGATGTLTICGTVWPMPGLTASRTHLVRADVRELSAASPEESEADLQAVNLPISEAVAAANDGRIVCAASALLVLQLATFR